MHSPVHFNVEGDGDEVTDGESDEIADRRSSAQGRRHGVDWGGHVHPTFAGGRS